MMSHSSVPRSLLLPVLSSVHLRWVPAAQQPAAPAAGAAPPRRHATAPGSPLLGGQRTVKPPQTRADGAAAAGAAPDKLPVAN